MKKNYILPLGSVVVLEKEGHKLSIIGRAQLFNRQGTIGIFDYAAVAYPEGIVSNNEFLFFNHEDIEEVIFEGYRNDEEKEFADKYDEIIAESNYPKLNVE